MNHPSTIKLFGQTVLAPGRQNKYLTWDLLQHVRTQSDVEELKPQCLFRRSLLNFFCSSLSLHLHLRRTQCQSKRKILPPFHASWYLLDCLKGCHHWSLVYDHPYLTRILHPLMLRPPINLYTAPMRQLSHHVDEKLNSPL